MVCNQRYRSEVGKLIFEKNVFKTTSHKGLMYQVSKKTLLSEVISFSLRSVFLGHPVDLLSDYLWVVVFQENYSELYQLDYTFILKTDDQKYIPVINYLCYCKFVIVIFFDTYQWLLIILTATNFLQIKFVLQSFL